MSPIDLLDPDEVDIELSSGVSRDARITLKQTAVSAGHYSKPISRQNEINQRFLRLVRQWKREKFFKSSSVDIAMNDSYQQIIGMGKDIIPLILKEYARELDHWAWALKAITGFNPVPRDVWGNLELEREYWFTWAIFNGYHW